MPDGLKVLVLFGSLPSYFPERHGVFEAARRFLPALGANAGAEITFYPRTLVNEADTREALAFASEAGSDFLLLLHGGFTMGDVARTLAQSDFRIGFWAIPEPVFERDIQLNNFVSLNMSVSIAAGVRDLATRPVAWYFGTADSSDFFSRFTTTLSALRIARATAGRRVGLIGGLAPTFYNMEVDRRHLAERWDTTILDLDIESLRAAATRVPEGAVNATVTAMAAAAHVATGVLGMQLSARYALALRDIAASEHLDALAISDWPALQDNPGFHPGAAFSWLEESVGMAIASEGDALGALSQIATITATGRPGCIVDLCAPDPATGLLLAWHGGGGPLHLAGGSEARWIDHPMMGRGRPGAARIGTIADFIFAPGPVTLLRVGRNGDTIFALEARVVEGTSPGFDGARGWLGEFRIGDAEMTLADVIETIMHHGLEHHFVLMPGHHGAVFAELATWTASRWQPASPAARYLPPAPGAHGGTRYET